MSLGEESYQHFGLHDNEELETFGQKLSQQKKQLKEETKEELDLQSILSKDINIDILSSNTVILIIFVVILVIIFYSFFLYSSTIAVPTNINKSQIDADKNFASSNLTNPVIIPNKQKNIPVSPSTSNIEQQDYRRQKKQHSTKSIIEDDNKKVERFLKNTNPESSSNEKDKQDPSKNTKQAQNKKKIQAHEPKPKKRAEQTRQFAPYQQQITHQIFVESFGRRALSTLEIGQKSSVADQQKLYYEQKYGINQFSQLPFCIVIPTENNSVRRKYLRNIRSIIMQDYSNYHFVVIDNASTDKTGILIGEELSKQKKIPSSKYKIIKHNERRTELEIIVKAARQFCKQDQIMMVVDGGDELIGAQVLKLFNAYMQKQDLLVAYSNSLMMPGMIGYSYPYPPKIIQDASYSSHTFLAQQVRAFYVPLILNIKDEDLKDRDGFYFDTLPQLAYMLPILQQAHTKIGYIPEIAYYYNQDKHYSDDSKAIELKEKSSEKIMRMRQKYPAISSVVIQAAHG